MNFRKIISNSALILFFYLIFSGFSLAGGYGQISVKTWADDRKSAFSFTFDDGNMSQYTYAVPVLDSFGFKGTFCIITGSDFTTDSLPGIDRYGTWEQFRAISLEGHEIGSHTIDHPDLDTLSIGDTLTPGTLLYELYQSQKTIEQKIPNQKCITLAYPYVAYDTVVMNATAQFYESARGSATVPNDPNLTGLEYYALYADEEEFNLPRNSPADDLDELTDFENYVDSSIAGGDWGMLEGHEVFPFSQIQDMIDQGSYYPISTEWLTSLCQWLKQKSDNNQLWIETVGNITRYMREREQFQYNITEQTDTLIQISATDNLNDQIYNYPLTVDITVPSDWEEAIVIQGYRSDTIKTFINGANTYVRTYVIPDEGLLILNKTTDPAMPVELTSFTVTIVNKDVHLNWKTSTEINCNRFDIERMLVNKPWEKVGSLPGAGNSNSPKSYSFIDNSSLSNGKYSYRLKQIDNDGNFKYISVVDVEVTFAPSSYALNQNYPNPFNPSTRIKYSIPFESNVKVIVFNALGEMVKELTNGIQEPGNYEINFNGLGISSGVYFYSLFANSSDGKQSFSETKKMILMK